MSKCITRHGKAKGKGSISAIQRHNQASEKDVVAIRNAEIKNTGKSDIILENLRYNRELLPQRVENFNEHISKVLDERLGGKKVRKDAVTLLDGIYTYSPEKTPNLLSCLHINDQAWKEKNKEMWDNYISLSKEERLAKANQEYKWTIDYFNKCLEFEKAHYGECISAEIHFHETTPHLHTNSIPLVKGDGKWKLSAKDIMGNKAKMSHMQTLFYEEVGKEFGLERGQMRNPTEVKKHLSKEQKALEDTKTENTKLTEQNKQLTADFGNLQEDYNELQKKYNEIIQMYKTIAEKLQNCKDIISRNIHQMTSELRQSVTNRQKAIEKNQEILDKVLKTGTPKIIFGQAAQTLHEVEQFEEELEEEFER